jgi:hypothetical protein
VPSVGTETIELGTLESESRLVEIPGDFSEVVTFVVTVAVEGIVRTLDVGLPQEAEAHWQVVDSISGDGGWYAVEDSLGRFTRAMTGDEPPKPHSQTARFVVPVGPKLAIVMWTRHRSGGEVDQSFVSVHHAVARVFWRKL